MRTASYKSVLDRIAGYLGEADGISTEDAVLIVPKVNLYVRLAWEYFWWPDLVKIEKRTFRPAWNLATAYVAAAEVFFPTVGQGNFPDNTGQYYQALQASTGQVPATLTNGTYVENGAYWALSCPSYSADLWQANTDYGVNNDGSGLPYQVLNPDDGNYYQCISAHTSGGTFDPTMWGVLTPFVRSIDYDAGATSNQGPTATPLGEVRFIWDRNPELDRMARQINKRLRADHVQVLGTTNVVWVEFRLRPATYTNTVISSTATYTAGIQVYDPATGENWVTLLATNMGDTPTNQPSKFQKVPFPYYFAEYVAQSVYVSLTNREQAASAGQPENPTIAQAAGFPLLLAELDKIERQQGQTRQLNVKR